MSREELLLNAILSTATLRELVDFASGYSAARFRKTGNVVPAYFAATKDRRALILPPPVADKDIAVELIKVMFAVQGVEKYVFVDEAWVLDRRGSQLPQEEFDKIRRTGLQDHPDRREIVMISAEDVHCGQLMAHRNIIRPAKGKATLGPLEVIEGISMGEGRMVGLLMPDKAARH